MRQLCFKVFRQSLLFKISVLRHQLRIRWACTGLLCASPVGGWTASCACRLPVLKVCSSAGIQSLEGFILRLQILIALVQSISQGYNRAHHALFQTVGRLGFPQSCDAGVRSGI